MFQAPSDQLSACVTITEDDTVRIQKQSKFFLTRFFLKFSIHDEWDVHLHFQMSMATCCDYALPFTNETVTKCKNKGGDNIYYH